MVRKMDLRVAFSTDDGKLLVDDHFGEGKFFYIYIVNDEVSRLVDIKENRSGAERVHGDPVKARKIAEILGDVDLIVGYRMGPNINRMKRRYLPIVSRSRDINTNIMLLRKNLDKIREYLNRKGIILIMEKNGEIRVVE
jgi:predicted Fe-Mo cluster-binding NifX family protein